MPNIKQDDLIGFHKEIEKNKEDAKRWEDLYHKRHNEFSNVKKNNNIYGIIVIILSLLLILYVFFSIYNPFWLPEKTEKLDVNNQVVLKQEYQELMAKADKFDNYVKEEAYDGVIYRVQIGAFKDFKISLFSDEFSNIGEYKNSYTRYTLGRFTKYSEATKFKNDLIKLGFKDSFLTSYKQNEPINIREALVLTNETEFLEQ